MFDWLFGRRAKTPTAPEVAVVEAKRDQLFVDAAGSIKAAKEATQEVDRVKNNMIRDFEDAERARLGNA